MLLVAGTLVTVHYLPFLRFLLSPPQPFAPNTEATLPPLPLPDKPSIVVLPFSNISEDTSQDYFSDGITEVWKQRVLYKDPATLERVFVALRKAGLK